MTCMVPLAEEGAIAWRQSTVYRKLARVLWLPLEAGGRRPLPERRIGRAVLWSPSAEEEAALAADWEELMDMVSLGGLDELDAKVGNWLQILEGVLPTHHKRLYWR